ncbi:Predicted membrane protein [Veillonella rodentium]|uniref:Predicted membrane protein n=1 Tax=Veillonella rodentium TaxID=248315 RepID=A0A239ZWR0_9FIRM|nr:Predicted membrane protein [Veillonella rodentium]
METAFVSTIVVMLTVIGAVVPFMLFLATIVAPAGISVTGIRWGSRYSCIASVLAFMMVALFLGVPIAANTVLIYSLPSIFLGEAFRSNWSFRKLIIVPALALFLMLFVQMLMVQGFGSFDLVNLGQNMNAELKNSMLEAVRQQAAPQEQIDTMVAQVNRTFAMADQVMIVIVFWGCVLMTYILAKLVSYIARRTDTLHRVLPPMDTWRMPIWGAGVLAIGIILVYGLSYIGYEQTVLKDVGMNLGLFGAAICFVNGVTCLIAIMKAYELGNFFQFAIIFFLYVMSPYSLVIYGIFDMFLDMRSRFNKRLP